MPHATRAIAALHALPCGERLFATLGEREDVWVVGGAVRDLLLGREPREVDLTILGDAEPVAELLGPLTERHERFGTARVETGDCRFDLARARVETYARPGALPDVAPAGTVREDLRRRDFTINAMALSLRGELIAVADAFEDLAAKRLRVLHRTSFTDDPTRLWRMARYGARLGFGVEEHTRRWAAEAVESGALQTVSGERIGNEVRLALAEDDPCAVLEQAVRLGLLDVAVDRARVARVLELLGGDGRADLAVAAACGLDLEGLGFTRAELRVVQRALALSPGPEAPHSATAGHFEGEPVEAVAVTAGPGAEWWLREGRHVTLEITGADLLAAGVPRGPEVGRRLRRALDAKLDGEIFTREEELAVALQ